MKIIQIVLICGATAAAAGCATNSREEIVAYSSLMYYSRLCAEAGMLDRAIAAKGMSIASSNIYRSDTPRLQARLKEMWEAGERPTQNKCNDIELQIMAGEATRNATPSSTSTQSYALPRQTTCSTAFGQTHCTSY